MAKKIIILDKSLVDFKYKRYFDYYRYTKEENATHAVAYYLGINENFLNVRTFKKTYHVKIEG